MSCLQSESQVLSFLDLESNVKSHVKSKVLNLQTNVKVARTTKINVENFVVCMSLDISEHLLFQDQMESSLRIHFHLIL
jgi:hypothetical protein